MRQNAKQRPKSKLFVKESWSDVNSCHMRGVKGIQSIRCTKFWTIVQYNNGNLSNLEQIQLLFGPNPLY